MKMMKFSAAASIVTAGTLLPLNFSNHHRQTALVTSMTEFAKHTHTHSHSVGSFHGDHHLTAGKMQAKHTSLTDSLVPRVEALWAPELKEREDIGRKEVQKVVLLMEQASKQRAAAAVAARSLFSRAYSFFPTLLQASIESLFRPPV